MLGGNIYFMLKEKYQIFGINHSQPLFAMPNNFFLVDICDEMKVKDIIKSVRPDILIHCASLTNVDESEKDFCFTHKVNAIATNNLISNCRKNTKFIYISTDSIFDGKTGNYSEKDLPCPMNNYAKTKLEGEWFVQQATDNYLILRTNIFGWSSQKKLSFGEWIFDSLSKNISIRMIKDFFFTPILVNDLIKIMSELIEHDARGFYHVAGSEKCSKYEFGIALAEIFRFDVSLIKPVLMDEFNFKAKRPKDMSLNCKKIQSECGIDIPGYKEGLKKYHELWQNGYAYNLKGKRVSNHESLF